jgi:hypothetical protein
VAVFGKQEFGNTAIDGKGVTPSSCATTVSWWTAAALAGDQITIDFEGGLDYLAVWPVGTTDFNIHSSETVKEYEIGQNDKQEAVFTTPVAGLMPLEFFTAEGGLGCGNSRNEPGPYDFIATVRHALAAALMPIAGIHTNSTVTGTASLVDGTPITDGIVFHLVAKWHSGSAAYRAATAGGMLSFALALPSETAGKTVRIVITRAEDSNYQAVKSVPLKVKVASPPTHPRHRHHHHRRHKCHKGFKKRRKHGKIRCVKVKPHTRFEK